MNVGKIRMTEAVKGYKLNVKEVGCKYHPDCFTCPFRDCIKGQKYDKDAMTHYGQHRTSVALETARKKAEKMRNFQEYLNDSCGEYQNEIAKEIVKGV